MGGWWGGCVWFISASAEVEGEQKRSRRWQLLSPGECAATNLGFAGVQPCTMGSLGGTPLGFRGGWQQMKLAGCGALFSPASANEQASPADWRNGSPAPPAFSLSSVSSVVHAWKTTGNTRIPADTPARPGRPRALASAPLLLPFREASGHV